MIVAPLQLGANDEISIGHSCHILPPKLPDRSVAKVVYMNDRPSADAQHVAIILVFGDASYQRKYDLHLTHIQHLMLPPSLLLITRNGTFTNSLFSPWLP